jgi:putative membrane protein
MTELNRKRSLLIEIEPDEAQHGPEAAPPVSDLPMETSVQRVIARGAAPRGGRLARWFWGSLSALLGFALSLAAWDFVTTLLARNQVLGGIALGLMALFLFIAALISLRELSTFGRLRRLDQIQKEAKIAISEASLAGARAVVDDLSRLYHGRADMRWGLARLKEQQGEVFDADGLLLLASHTLLDPLDARAMSEVEAASRQVAAVTAIVPLALADVATALAANLRMIRRIAEIYGGRAGTLGSWRLARSVLGHLVATGAVAVGDDLIGSVAGGGVLSKVSRRFGEGVINGALTARVGLAAIDVCRPIPFAPGKRASASAVVARALKGLFGSSKT